MRASSIFILCAALNILGCATPAARQFAATNATMVAAKTTLKSCGDALNNSPQYAQLGQHLAIRPPATLEQLADNSMPTQDQRTTLLQWHQGVQACRAPALDSAQASFPFMVGALQQNYANMDSIYLRLIQRQLSFGAANQALAIAKIEGAEHIRQAFNDWSGELQQENRGELAERAAAVRAAGASLQQAGAAIQQQQLIHALNRPAVIAPSTPVTTTCNSFGTMTTCSSR